VFAADISMIDAGGAGPAREPHPEAERT